MTIELEQQNAPVRPPLVQALYLRLKLSIVKDFLRAKNLPLPSTWDDLAVRHGSNKELLEEILAERLCFGDKGGYLFDISDVDSDCLQIPQVGEPRSVFNLLKQPPNTYTFVCSWQRDDVYCFTYAINRRRLEQQCLVSSDLSSEARGKYWKDDSVIKISTPVNYCAFDTIMFDVQNSRVAILIDDRHHSNQTDHDSHLGEFMAFIDTCGQLKPQLTLIDLFGHIGDMYRYKDEGLVSRLSFECSTGAVRDERLKNNQQDLRTERYHQEGSAAVAGISPYRIQITYIPNTFTKNTTELELSLNGTRRSLHTRNGVTRFAIDSQSFFQEAIFAVRRLSLYATNE